MQDLTEHFNVLWDEDDKIVDETKLKEFADVLLSIAEAVLSLSGRVENIVGKGENAGYQYFLIFLHFFFFQIPSLPWSSKLGNMW